MRFNGEISTLAELVNPMTQQELFHCYNTQQPVFIHGGTPSRVAKLIDVNDISKLIQAETFLGRRIRLVRNGEEIPPMFWTDGGSRMSLSLIRGVLNAGASLVVNGLQETHPKIGDLAQALELEFSSDVWVNGYVTTKDGGAFDVHYDNHDVIILQISGSKRWYLYGQTEEFPVDQFSKDLHKNAPKAEEKIDILCAGEVLFVPRGEWHRAEVVDSPSFHLTIGIDGETGIGFVAQAVNDLKKEALFRKYLPRVGGEKLLLEHDKKLKSFLHDWVERLSVKAFLASRDASRPTRSEIIPWNPIPLNSETKIWLALRRKSPIVDLDSTEIVVGGKAYDLCPMDRLILQIIGEYGVLRFDELIGQVRGTGNTTAEVELATSTILLAEFGLLNISMDDEASEHDLKRDMASEPKQDVPHGSLGPSTERSRQETA
jgi:hypothetical protein